MDFLKDLILFLDAKMTRPEVFGWYHFLCLGLVILASYLLCRFMKQGTDRQVRAVLLTISITCILFEIYKQCNYTFTVSDGQIVADYQWYAFPWQFCCVPMFVGLLAGILGKGKVYRALCTFLGTYSLFAGICVMIYPENVFIETIGINIETMYCHGAMVVQGVYLLYTGYVKPAHKTVLYGVPVFCTTLGIAIVANEIAHYTDFTGGETFNMFYVSPHEDPSLPLYSIVQQYVPYPFCLIIYIMIFTLAAYIMVLIAMGLSRISGKLKKKSA